MRKLPNGLLILLLAAILVAMMVPAATHAQGGAINPLTGLPVKDARILQRRPIAVKVENSPQARPQSGLDQADVVYESLAEFRETRFCLIFLANVPSTVGPVRSARPSDIEIAPQYQAALAYSGASEPVKAMLKASPDIPLIGQMEDYYAYRRIPRGDLAYEHTLYASVPKLWETIARHNYGLTANLSGWQFASPPIGAPNPAQVAHVEVPFAAWSLVSYRYDARLGLYRRFQQGEPHRDRESGQQYTATNVVIQFVGVVEGPYVGYSDGSGTNLLIQNLTGEGRCIVLRGGVATNGRWIRTQRNALTRFVDDAGQPILFNPGQTWIEVVPTDLDVKVTIGAPYTGGSSTAAGAASAAPGSAGKITTRPTGHGEKP